MTTPRDDAGLRSAPLVVRFLIYAELCWLTLRGQLAQSYGQWLLTVVAVGLLCYGLFCFVQSRYVRTDAS